MTLQEFERLPKDGMHYELDQGELVTMARPLMPHTAMQMRLIALLLTAAQRGLGKVYFQPGCKLGPDTVRYPDVGFLSGERARVVLRQDYIESAPELAIEIVSPSQPAEVLGGKIKQYIAAGAQAVWVIDPGAEEVWVYGPDTPGARVLQRGDTLEAPGILPGWSVPVDSIFEN